MTPAGSASQSVLEVRELCCHRGAVQVLAIPALSLGQGEVLAVIGPNGSGKTTLLKALATLLPAETAHFAFLGQPLVSAADRFHYRGRSTMVFQDPLLFDLTVQGNLEAGLKLRGLPRAERQDRVVEVAQTFGIHHLLGRRARELSGGEAQRTALARALALRPELLFLDEPFAALDPPTREGLLDDLAVALKATGTAAVLATHDQMEALRLARTLVVMDRGRIVQKGPAAEVINHPLDEFVAGFVGMETLLTGSVADCGDGLFRVAVGGHEVECVGEACRNQEALVGIRPEQVTLSLRPEGPSSARNSFPGTVLRVTPRGPYLKVDLDCGFFLTAFVTSRSLEELGLAPGSQVMAHFKATAVHVIRLS